MQTIQGDASENVHSLDYFYSENWIGKIFILNWKYKSTCIYYLYYIDYFFI